MTTTRIMHSITTSPATSTSFARAVSPPRKTTPLVTTPLWRSAVALVDHPSDAPPQ